MCCCVDVCHQLLYITRCHPPPEGRPGRYCVAVWMYVISCCTLPGAIHHLKAGQVDIVLLCRCISSAAVHYANKDRPAGDGICSVDVLPAAISQTLMTSQVEIVFVLWMCAIFCHPPHNSSRPERDPMCTVDGCY